VADVGLEPPAAEAARDGGEVADVGEVLRGIVEQRKVPALAAAVVREGRIVARGVVGVRAAGSEEKVTLGDLWHLGSCTKAMTATLAGTFVERGEIAWETTIGEVFGDVTMHEGWRGVTLRQLLTNRGGVPGDLSAGGLWGRLFVFGGTPREARMELVKGVLSREPARKPGEAFEYSNGGFAIAGAMLERKADAAWEALVVERVLRPLGVTSAGFGAPGSAGVVDQPRGHRNGKAVAPGIGADNPSAIGPAGTAHMTIEDWARFVGAHASGERGAKDGAFSLLKPETFVVLHTPGDVKDTKNAYAMGWGVAERAWAKGKGEGDRGRVLTHAGSNTMWFCVAWVAPEREFAVVVATNAGDEAARRATDEAAGALIERFGR